jgi:hypothetical protein
MVRTFFAPHSKTTYSGQEINNHEARKNRKDQIKFLDCEDSPLSQEG